MRKSLMTLGVAIVAVLAVTMPALAHHGGAALIDPAGAPHSEQLKVTERFHRVAFDRLELDIIMEDALALAKPWTSRGYFELRPEWELGEISCSGDYLEWPGA